MNVIIANKQKDKLNDLSIEIIKRLDGEFEVDEIISSFQNIFYGLGTLNYILLVLISQYFDILGICFIAACQSAAFFHHAGSP